MPAERTITFTADGLSLEGRLHLPDGATRGVVICHPHPQYGGTLDNNVVGAVATALGAAGFATLRFNFRGVGASAGTYAGGAGEVVDACAALEYLQAAGPQDVALTGYSFGAAVAARAVAEAPHLASHLVTIAPPLSFAPLDFLDGCRLPKLLIAGDHDEYCPVAAVERTFARLPEPKELRTVSGADHFFLGFEDTVGAEVVRFCEGASG